MKAKHGFLALLLLAAALLAACGPTATPAPTVPPTRPAATLTPTPTPIPPTPTPIPPSPTPLPPVVLHLHLQAEPPTIDPAWAVDQTSIDVIENLFLGLTTLHPTTSEALPELAISWEASADATVWTFHMRDDVYWVRYDPATGSLERLRPVTADDVVYGLRRSLMPEMNSDYAHVLYVIKNAAQIHKTPIPTKTYDLTTLGVRALDDYTVRFELEEPAAYFPTIAGLWVARPQPREAIENEGQDHFWGWTEPGNIWTNGAYALAEWEHNDHLILVKNPFHFRAGEVQIDVAEFTVVEKCSTANAIYENGEFDTVLLHNRECLPNHCRSDPITDLFFFPGSCTHYYVFNAALPPFDDVHVRRAFSMAIDRGGLVENITRMGEPPAHTLAPPGVWGSPAGDYNVGILADPEWAREELAAAGYPEGVGFPPITLIDMTYSEQSFIVASAIQHMWREFLGVEVDLLDAGAFDPPLPNGARYDYHTWPAYYCTDYPDEHNWLYKVFSPDSGTNSLDVLLDDPQVGSYVQEFYELIQAAAGELDPTRRTEMYKRAEHLLVYEIAAIAPIYHTTRIYRTQPYLQRDYPVFGGIEIERWRIER